VCWFVASVLGLGWCELVGVAVVLKWPWDVIRVSWAALDFGPGDPSETYSIGKNRVSA
jgi:hypothetical protein